MSRKPKRDLQREREVLSSKVRMDGVGEDPVVKKLLSNEFTTMPNEEAFDVAMALQKLVRGQESLLANQDKMSSEIAKMREKQAAYDNSERMWNENREKFLEEVAQKAASLRISDPIEKAKLEGKQGLNFSNEIKAARAEVASDRLRFEEQLTRMPKVKIISSGRMVQTRSGDSQKFKVMAEVVKIKHRTWVLPPNQVVEVPEIVAQVLAGRSREREASEKLKDAMDVNQLPSDTQAAKTIQDLNTEYWSGKDGEKFPIGSDG